jgi:hypothetical protein
MDHAGPDLEDVGTEGGDDGMLYNAMDEDEEAEQDAARCMQEELKHKRLVSDTLHQHGCCTVTLT